MTVREHSERVRFDNTLVDQYIPKNRFRRIFPLDPGCGELAANGEELEEVYAKLEKVSKQVWKKSVGMVSKKDTNPNVHAEQKKKKRKNRKNLLTSMTTHIKPKNPDQGQAQDDELEEDPEDGVYESDEEPNNERFSKSGYDKRRDSN